MTNIFELTGTLTTRSPLTIGSDSDGNLIDRVQFIDGADRITIPGTSLTGAIRSASHEGAVKGWGSKDSASNITVFDAHATSQVPLAIRSSVAIDRNTGTAVDRHLFRREVVPRGTDFRLRVIVETRAGYSDDDARADLKHIVSTLGLGDFAAGSSTSRGFGNLQLTQHTVVRRSIDRTGLRKALFGGEEVRTLTANVGTVDLRAGVLRITVPWTPLGTVMSKVAVEGGVADAEPLTEWERGDATDAVRLVIPGSSIKGVLRTHAERIARTLTGREVPSTFLQQMKAAGLPGVGDLFGLAADDNDSANVGRRGVLTVQEVCSTVGVNSAHWQSVREAAAEPLAGESHSNESTRNLSELAKAVDDFNSRYAGDPADPPGIWLDVVMRNSIDRWTGGTAQGRLYSTVEPHATWEPIRIDVDVDRLRRLNRENPAGIDAALALLLFELIDACAGWLAIGYATTRGLGSFTVDAEEIRFTGDIAAAATDHAQALVEHETLAQLLTDTALLEAMSACWTSHLSAAIPTPTGASR